MALDIGLEVGPSLANFHPGANEAVRKHLELWVKALSSTTAVPNAVPSYLWGPAGSGKTHLLKAAHAALRERGASSGWLDTSVPDEPLFDESWAAVIMDDVDAYSGAQQALAFRWFVQAHSLQRPVLAAGMCAPLRLDLREDLRSRLGWGHVFSLQTLSEPECRAVLRQAADARGVFLGDDVMDFMLTRFSRDLASLMELLKMLDGYAMQSQRAITIPLIKSMLEST
jgi:DnaA family protein